MEKGITDGADDENVFISLENRAKKIGLKIRALCRLAGVDKDTFTRGKKKEPESIKIVKKLTKSLEEKEAEFNQSNKE